MSGKRRGAASLVVAALAVALAACGGSSGSSGKSSPKPKVSATSSSAPTPIQSAPPTAKNVIVIGSCDSSTGTRHLNFVDPAGWAVKSQDFAVTPPQETSAADCNAADSTPGTAMRNAFDKNFQHMAVQEGPKELPPPDGAPYHTGVIAAGEGGFTDLSGAQDEDPSGFSAATQQSPGAYGPDGKLYFVQVNDDRTDLMMANPNGGKPQRVRELDIPGYTFKVIADASGADFLYFVQGDARPQMYDSRYHEAACSDGYGFWTSDTDSYLYHGQTGTKGSKIELNVGEGFNPIGCIDHKSFYDFSNNTVSRVTIADGTPKRHNLLPKTDGEISQPVVSSDGQNVAFLLKKGDEYTLYTVPSTGGTPKKSHLPSLAGPVKVIAWEDVAGLN